MLLGKCAVEFVIDLDSPEDLFGEPGVLVDDALKGGPGPPCLDRVPPEQARD
jgi:hypothetical protein